MTSREELTATLQAAKQIGLMQRDEHAAELWREIYGELAADRDGLAGSILARAEAHVLRFSLDLRPAGSVAARASRAPGRRGRAVGVRRAERRATSSATRPATRWPTRS